MSKRFARVPDSSTLHPSSFEVAFTDAALDEFKTLLRLSKLAPPTFEGAQEDRKYGVTNKWMRAAKDTWENDFNWREHEAQINTFPHFIAPIVDDDGRQYKIHFVALFSEKANAVPLLLLHGWPGSFLEFLPILSILSNKYTPSSLPYHVIVPSLPGYTFSSGPPLDKDFGVADITRIVDKLAVGLGFDGYVAHGGDIGSVVATELAANYKNCKAYHVNLCMATKPVTTETEDLSELERQAIAKAAEFRRTGFSYASEHGTRPSTIGHVLASSPVALLAWIGEKFLEWTDEDPPLHVILESVTLYWLTETFPRAIYPYRVLVTPPAKEAPVFPNKPFGFSWFPKEILPMPRSWIAATGNLVFFRQHTEGGHFAALEKPDILLKDIEDFISQVLDVGRQKGAEDSNTQTNKLASL